MSLGFGVFEDLMTSFWTGFVFLSKRIMINGEN